MHGDVDAVAAELSGSRANYSATQACCKLQAGDVVPATGRGLTLLRHFSSRVTVVELEFLLKSRHLVAHSLAMG